MRGTLLLAIILTLPMFYMAKKSRPQGSFWSSEVIRLPSRFIKNDQRTEAKRGENQAYDKRETVMRDVESDVEDDNYDNSEEEEDSVMRKIFEEGSEQSNFEDQDIYDRRAKFLAEDNDQHISLEREAELSRSLFRTGKWDYKHRQH